MRIDLAHDRLDHQPANYRDPVVAREGVFALIEEGKLSEAEQARLQKEEELAAKAAASTPKVWTPKAVLKLITKLYAGFVKPKGDAS